MLPRSTALVLIDAQKGWDDPYWGERNNPEAEGNVARLLQAFRCAHRPVVHAQYVSKDPNSPFSSGEPGTAFKPEASPLPNEKVVVRSAYSAFHGTDLETYLRGLDIDRLLLAGFTTNWGISSTARAAQDLGFKVVLVRDACAAFAMEDPFGKMVCAEELHRVGLAELHGTFGVVLCTEDVHIGLGTK